MGAIHHMFNAFLQRGCNRENPYQRAPGAEDWHSNNSPNTQAGNSASHSDELGRADYYAYLKFHVAEVGQQTIIF